MKIKPPSTNHVDRIADWIELFVFVSQKPISKSKIVTLLEGEDISVQETDVDSAINELGRRLNLYGSKQPFKIEGNRIIPTVDWKKYPEFALCLYFSTYGVGKLTKGAKADNGTKLFENITEACLSRFFDSESYLFGFPSNKSFKDQLDEFASKISERRDEDPNASDKDRGVDLIIYKRLDSSRTNSILFFVQCAAGRNWNEKKPVSIDSYHRYVRFNRKATIPSIATTQVINIGEWQNACDDYGVIIDRARLYKISSSQTGVIPTKLKKELQTWLKTKLN